MFQMSDKQMRTVAGMLLVVLGLVYVINVSRRQGLVDANGELIGCDFVAFYGAAKDVLAGESARLYDFNHQRRIHQTIAANETWDYFYPYVNPPFFAAWVLPFAALPYVPAFGAWAAASLVALLVSVWLLGRAEGLQRKALVTAMLVAVAFPAAFMNLAGGQNGAFSLLLLTACVLLQFRARDFEAGLVLGFLLFKPQLVITMAALWLIKRRWQALAGVSIVGGALALACFLFMPTASYDFANLSGKLHTLAHQGSYPVWKQCSWYGFFTLAMHPQWPVLLRVLTALSCLLTFAVLLRAWRHPWDPNSESFKLQMAAVIVASLLISPHLYVYDLTILVLPGMLLAGHAVRSGERSLWSSTLVWPVMLFFALPVCLQVAQLTSVQPSVFLLLALLTVLVRLATGARQPQTAPGAYERPRVIA